LKRGGGDILKYVDLLESLQKKKENEGHIVMMKNGLFFIGIGKDAIILNKLQNLKCVCMKENLVLCQLT
jgi:hypothetical protein